MSKIYEQALPKDVLVGLQVGILALGQHLANDRPRPRVKGFRPIDAVPSTRAALPGPVAPATHARAIASSRRSDAITSHGAAGAGWFIIADSCSRSKASLRIRKS